MDEPTSSLTLTETERLLQVIADLKARGRQRHLHLASAQRGAGLRRPCRRAARRQPRRRARQGRDQPRRDDPADDRPRPQGDLPAAGGAAGRRRAGDRRAADRRPIPTRASTLTLRRGEILGLAGPGRRRPHRARPGRLRHRPAASAAQIRLDGAADRRSPRRATRSPPASTWCPRTARPRACCSTCRSPTTSRCPDLPAYAALRHRPPAGRGAPRPRPSAGGSASARRRSCTRRRHAVGRQPAEGGAGEVARHAAESDDLRRADPRHRRRRQARDLRDDARRWPTPASRC